MLKNLKKKMKRLSVVSYETKKGYPSMGDDIPVMDQIEMYRMY